MKLFLCCIIIFICQISCSKNYLERELNDSYIGIIKDIYIDKNNHSVTKFDIICSNQIEISIIADFYPDSKRFAEIGDSIIKKKGDPFFKIKKNSEKKESKIFNTKFK